MSRKSVMDPASFGALPPRQRAVFAVLIAGTILPLFFAATIRPVFWVAAVQLACVAGLAYIRWRSPVIRGSAVVLGAAVIGCLASVAAALAG